MKQSKECNDKLVRTQENNKQDHKSRVQNSFPQSINEYGHNS